MTRDIRQDPTDRAHSGCTSENCYQIEPEWSSAAVQNVPASSSGRDLILRALNVFIQGQPESHIASISFPPSLLQIERGRGWSLRLSDLGLERVWRNGFADLRPIIDFVAHRTVDLSAVTNCMGAARRHIARTPSVLEAERLARLTEENGRPTFPAPMRVSPTGDRNCPQSFRS